MFAVVVVIVLLLALFALTVYWAFSQLRVISGRGAPARLSMTRVLAAGVSFFVVLVVIAASVSGLVHSDVQGVDRLIIGLSWGPVQAALFLCVALSVVPLAMTMAAIIRHDWTTGARVQTAVYVAMLLAVIGLLIALSFSQ